MSHNHVHVQAFFGGSVCYCILCKYTLAVICEVMDKMNSNGGTLLVFSFSTEAVHVFHIFYWSSAGQPFSPLIIPGAGEFPFN